MQAMRNEPQNHNVDPQRDMLLYSETVDSNKLLSWEM